MIALLMLAALSEPPRTEGSLENDVWQEEKRRQDESPVPPTPLERFLASDRIAEGDAYVVRLRTAAGDECGGKGEPTTHAAALAYCERAKAANPQNDYWPALAPGWEPPDD